MTATTPTHVDTSIPEIWAKRALRNHLRAGFWGRFVGSEGSRSPILQKSELLNNPGDTIRIQVTSPLSGAGVEGDTAQLEGNEENLTTSEMTVVPVLYRHAVRVYRRAQKKSILNLRSEARMRLSEWGGEKMDDLRFANFLLGGASGAQTLNGEAYEPNVYVVGGGADADAIAAGDTLTVDAVQEIALKLYEQQAIPLRIDGDEYFVLVTSPRSLHSLKRETEYRDWVREAHIRGADNPFFKGATAVLDGVIIYRHTNVPVANNATAVPVSAGLAFGAEAFIEGVDERVSWDEDTFDYGNEFGVAYGFATQPRRGLEKNSVQVFSSSPNPF